MPIHGPPQEVQPRLDLPGRRRDDYPLSAQKRIIIGRLA
jgi:hypothetical protein